MFNRVSSGSALMLILVSSIVFADAPSAPIDKVYVQECGACHAPFPRNALGVTEWQNVLRTLPNHFGTDASVSKNDMSPIAKYLGVTDLSATTTSTKSIERSTLRVTATPWFKRKHHELNPSVWRDPRIKSLVNCGACHSQASSGSFREREIQLPNGIRWDD